MIIVELRGTIITVRSEKLSSSYLDQFLSLKADLDKSVASILLDEDLESSHKDFNSHFEQRGLRYDKRGEVIITGFEKDSYYEEGYSFFRSKLHQLDTLHDVVLLVLHHHQNQRVLQAQHRHRADMFHTTCPGTTMGWS